MKECVYSPQAQSDLDEIFRYIARESQSISIAVSHEQKMIDRCHLLADFPLSGVVCTDTDKRQSRRIIHQSYIIYYRPLENGVYVTRIVNSKLNQWEIRGT